MRIQGVTKLSKSIGSTVACVIALLFVSMCVVAQDFPRHQIEQEMRIKAEALMLGRPTSEMQSFKWERTINGNLIRMEVWKQDFSGARMYWTPVFRARAVRGEILARYDSEGADRGQLALAAGDEMSCELMGKGSVSQGFLGGAIYWRPATRETSIFVPQSIGDYFNAPRCSTPPPEPKLLPARFRVILTGFTVDKQTSDHILETDGKGDEVYIVAEVGQFASAWIYHEREWRARHHNGVLPAWDWLLTGDGINGRGPVTNRRSLTSVVMGDEANQEVPRIRAGTAGPSGGLRTGDSFPTHKPWILTGTPSANRLPMLLWEGELSPDGGVVMIMPTIWEWDNGNVGGRNHFRQATDNFFKIYTQRDGAHGNDGYGERDITGAGDRPIGWIGAPAGFKLNLSQALRAVEDTSGKYGSGVFPIPYKDGDSTEAYTLFVKIERLP